MSSFCKKKNSLKKKALQCIFKTCQFILKHTFLHAYMYNTQLSTLHSNFLTAQDSNNCETIPFGTTKYFNNTAGVKKSTSLTPGASNFHICAS